MNRPALHCFFTAAALMLAHAAPAQAQYAWLDERGVRQYSDRPPPATVPAQRILKQPNHASPGPDSGTSATRGETREMQPPAENAPSTAERNAAFRKRRADQAEKEKTASTEAKLASDKARHCERALEYDRALNSGARIARAGENGERHYLTDEQRAQELKETQRLLADCK